MISTEQLDAVIDFVAKNGASETTISSLRESFPGVHFTYCMDDDVASDRVYIEREDFNVYLVDSNDHCSTLTKSAESASGLVIAEVIE